MTISSEITRINNNIAAAYTACNNKGATMPQTQNSENLATCIGSISTGGGSVDGYRIIKASSWTVSENTSSATVTAIYLIVKDSELDNGSWYGAFYEGTDSKYLQTVDVNESVAVKSGNTYYLDNMGALYDLDINQHIIFEDIYFTL